MTRYNNQLLPDTLPAHLNIFLNPSPPPNPNELASRIISQLTMRSQCCTARCEGKKPFVLPMKE